MKFAVVVLCAMMAVAQAALTPILPAATLLRTPQLDTAIINSDRVGANFAYSTVEGHAYQAVAPVFRAAYPYTVSTYPYALPAVQQYIATGPLPVISAFAPLPTLDIASAQVGKAENVENAGAANTENNPAQAEGAKVDADSVSVESA